MICNTLKFLITIALKLFIASWITSSVILIILSLVIFITHTLLYMYFRNSFVFFNNYFVFTDNKPQIVNINFDKIAF